MSSHHGTADPRIRDPITPPRNKPKSIPEMAHGQQIPPFDSQYDDIATAEYDKSEMSTIGMPTSFSPSKARAQAQATYQITVLRTWLQDLFDEHEAASEGTITTAKQLKHQLQRQQHPLVSRWENEYIAMQQQRPTPSSTSMGYTAFSSDIDLMSSTITTTTTTANDDISATEILKALQDLMYINQSADSHRKLLHEARVEEVSRLESHISPATRTMMTQTQNETRHGIQTQTPPTQALQLLEELDHAVCTNPNFERALDSLSETATTLGVNLHDVSSPFASSLPSQQEANSVNNPLLIDHIFHALQHQTTTSHNLVSTITQVQTHLAQLKKQLRTAQAELSTLQSKINHSSADVEKMQAQTSQWTKETKLVTAKIQEYTDRIAALNRSRPATMTLEGGKQVVLVEDVVRLQDEVGRRKDLVKRLEDRVRLFHGLPPDLEASREEVQRAKDELEALKRRREELFQNMVL